MILKEIELNGFKSFKEKTKLVFDADVVAIVGPNGAGKSNIVDAVKWLLGEQSPPILPALSLQAPMRGTISTFAPWRSPSRARSRSRIGGRVCTGLRNATTAMRNPST